MTNAPRINVPITLTGNVLKGKGDSATLYLRNTQVQNLLQEKQILNLLSIFSHQQTLLVLFERIYAQFISILLKF